MDGFAVIGTVIGGSGLVLSLGIFIGSRKVVQKDITALDKAVHRLANRVQGFPDDPNAVYARKDVIEVQLGAIQARVDHIGSQVDRLVGGGA